MNLNVLDLKVWVPAKIFEESKRFYLELDCKLNWLHESGLAEMELGGFRFLLQDYYLLFCRKRRTFARLRLMIIREYSAKE